MAGLTALLYASTPTRSNRRALSTRTRPAGLIGPSDRQASTSRPRSAGRIVGRAGADDLVLVGHSYGGMVITGVADRIPAQLDSLVFLDALAPDDGESCWDLVNDEERHWYLASTTPAPVYCRCRSSILGRVRIRWPRPCSRLFSRVISGASAAAIVYALQWPGESPLQASYDRVRDDPAWATHELDGKHNLMRDNPDELLQILLDMAAR